MKAIKLWQRVIKQPEGGKRIELHIILTSDEHHWGSSVTSSVVHMSTTVHHFLLRKL